MMAAISKSNHKILQLIQNCAQRLRSNTPADYDSILASIGDAKVVMIGEASHGIYRKNYFDK
jgi:erythromycin esterase-like protein